MTPANEDTIRSALAFLNPDDRETWVMAGMAIKAEVGPIGYLVREEGGCNGASAKEKDAQSGRGAVYKNGGGVGRSAGGH